VRGLWAVVGGERCWISNFTFHVVSSFPSALLRSGCQRCQSQGQRPANRLNRNTAEMHEYSICTLEKQLATARDIARARSVCLGTCSEPYEMFQKVSGGLSTLLVGLLSDAYVQWQKLLESVTNSSRQAFCNSEEVKKLQRVLTFLSKVSSLDTTLGEEIGRAGSQTILSRLMEEIKMSTCIVETNGSCEEDFDALMDLLDAACEIYVPGMRGDIAFTDEELTSRLPLLYDLRPADSDNETIADTTTILIHQVNKRQTAQADVGYLMWPSAIVLSRWLLSNIHVLKNKMILEIGAGCGLVGILAAAIVKKYDTGHQVIITDVNNTVLENIVRNIRLNDVNSVASVAKLDFYQQTGDNHDGKWIAGECGGISGQCDPVDIILAADIICQPSDATAAAKTIYDSLVPGGVAYVVCANEKHRFGVDMFAGECQSLNLEVKSTDVKEMYDGGLVTECMNTAAGFVDGMTMTFFEVYKSTL
jgi:predicted nicotinamide N-methyase